MIRKIEVDGNDGTGKSYRIEKMKELFPGLVYYDRGIFSKATLNEKLFQNKNLQEWYKEKEDFIILLNLIQIRYILFLMPLRQPVNGG
jgi:hypothetical protein